MSCDLTTANACDMSYKFSFNAQFNEYESLEGYKLINGWVKCVRAWSCKEKLVITGMVGIYYVQVCIQHSPTLIL